MPITPSPDAPSRGDPTTFPDKADAFVAWQENNLVPEINALELNVNQREASTVAASNQATAASAAAVSASNAALWVSGTTYAAGVTAIDTVNFQPYRRIVAGAGTTRPALDAANWTSAIIVSGFRNRLINANPIINQRGYVSGTATTTANQYTLDRWRVVTSGQSVSWTDSGLTRTVICPAGGFEQVIESLNIEGGTFTLNWTGTATATVNGAAVLKGGTFTLPANTNATVRFSGGTLAEPQLEAGNVSTPFERRDYGRELMMCQRYYCKSFDAALGIIPGDLGAIYSQTNTTSTTSYDTNAQVRYPVFMRATPSAVTLHSPTQAWGNNSWRSSSDAADITVAVVSSNSQGFSVRITSLPTGQWCRGHYQASAEL